MKTVSDNAAIVKQAVKVAKIDAKNEIQVEKQDDSDKLKIRQLEDDLSAARRATAVQRVPKPAVTKCVPSAEAHAPARAAGDATRESADRYEEAYRTFRDDLLVAGAVAEQLRLQVLACQAQWPK
jgi:hypothetical protein